MENTVYPEELEERMAEARPYKYQEALGDFLS